MKLFPAVAILILSILVSCGDSRHTPSPKVSGIVHDENGPLAGATVRVQATTNQIMSDDQGRFVLVGLKKDIPVTISAWKEGYYCSKVEGVIPPKENVSLTLRLYQTNDNPKYKWIPPIGESSCYSCKPAVTQVWFDNDAHSRSAINQRFLNMYNGTDVNGDQSPLTRYVYNPDYGRIPLKPDLSQPYYGPGYKLDFPNTVGNCSACHIPGAAVDAPYGTNPNTIEGINKFGVHCDFCHKVADIKLSPWTGLPFPNMPGVLSMDIRRPFSEDPERYQLFFGTFDDDNVPEEDTYLPLIKESLFCAPCHFGVFWDTVIYNSFGEWLGSPYSNPLTGMTCQNCHMPAPTFLNGEQITNVAPGKGGVERDPMTIHAHTFPGAGNKELLHNSVTMITTAKIEGKNMIVQIDITNDKTGHHVPTDSPLRHMILIVDAVDDQGRPLPLIDGPTVPDWGGIGNRAKGYYAGLPGKAFAKVLEELWTEISPSSSYWNPTRVLSDNRIPAFTTDRSRYIFAVPESSDITVHTRLIFRRAYKQLMDWKGWNVPDVVMEEQRLNIR